MEKRFDCLKKESMKGKWKSKQAPLKGEIRVRLGPRGSRSRTGKTRNIKLPAPSRLD